MTGAQRKVLLDVRRRSKGLPVGIPIARGMAKKLVELGLCRWAPPAWAYPQPVFCVALTSAGRAALECGPSPKDKSNG